jgi:hypothetical protein
MIGHKAKKVKREEVANRKRGNKRNRPLSPLPHCPFNHDAIDRTMGLASLDSAPLETHRCCEKMTNDYVSEELRMLAERELLLEEQQRMMGEEKRTWKTILLSFYWTARAMTSRKSPTREDRTGQDNVRHLKSLLGFKTSLSWTTRPMNNRILILTSRVRTQMRNPTSRNATRSNQSLEITACLTTRQTRNFTEVDEGRGCIRQRRRDDSEKEKNRFRMRTMHSDCEHAIIRGTQ